MRKIALFFKGVKQAFKDSWFAILVLLLTCLVGVVGVGFCYRTAVFEIRQPENNYSFAGKDTVAYIMSGDNLNLGEKIDIKGYAGIDGYTTFVVQDKKCDLDIYSYDYHNEKVLDFANKDKKVVLNENINVNVGDSIKINGVDYLVAGKTQNKSYVSVNSLDKVNGTIYVYFDEQISRADMSELENIIGVKMARDGNWQGKLTTQHILFIVLGVFVMVLISINVFRLFNLYCRKNDRRYKLYKMVGMTQARVNAIMFGEILLILILCLPLPLLIDYFAFRPLTKIVGITYMYDIIDFAVISACVLVPFILVLLIKLTTQTISNAMRNRKVRGKEYEEDEEE